MVRAQPEPPRSTGCHDIAWCIQMPHLATQNAPKSVLSNDYRTAISARSIMARGGSWQSRRSKAGEVRLDCKVFDSLNSWLREMARTSPLPPFERFSLRSLSPFRKQLSSSIAEPVGLALGAVALVSLFSNCVELIEYFELGRSFEYDNEKACLKLSLLQDRLRRCDSLLQQGEHESRMLDKDQSCNWLDVMPQDNTVWLNLRGIYDLLTSVENLKDKYSLAPTKSRTTILSSFRGIAARKQKRQALSEVRPSQTNLTRRSTTRAIRDKRRFDQLISDLDSFISNLEPISPTSPRCSKMAPEKISDAEKDLGKVSLERERGSGETANHTNQANKSGKRSGAPVLKKVAKKNHKSELGGAILSVAGIDEDARGFEGTIDNAKFSEAPPDTTFNVGIMKGRALLIQGAMSRGAFQDFLMPSAKKE